MAYPVYCAACLVGEHSWCIEKDPAELEERRYAMEIGIVGGAFCVCWECSGHEPNAFAQEIKERDMKTLEEQAR